MRWSLESNPSWQSTRPSETELSTARLPSASFVTVMAWFTLWSFLGVLVLPTLSRPAELAADR